MAEDKLRIKQPFSEEAEKLVLAAILQEPELLGEFKLGSGAFHNDTHRRIYNTLLKMEAEGKEIAAFNLFIEIDHGLTEKEARAIASMDVLSSQAEEAAGRLRELATRRKLVVAAYRVEKLAADQEQGIEQVCSAAEQQILGATEDQMSSADWYEMRELVQRYMEYQQEKAETDGVIGVATTYSRLDDTTGGLQDGTLTYVGARPSMGKTDLGLNIALNASAVGEQVLFFSLEMGWERLMERTVSNAGPIVAKHLLHGLDTSDTELWRKYQRALSEIERRPIMLNDTGGLTLEQISSITRRADRKVGVDLIIIDYLQKISMPYRSGMSGDMMVKQVSNGLADLAKNLRIPILCFSQLSREVERRNNKRPRLADLRESGNLEQDADQVWGLYRHAYYNQDEAEESGFANITELLMLKARDAPVGRVLLKYQPAFHKFEEAGSYVYANYPYG